MIPPQRTDAVVEALQQSGLRVRFAYGLARPNVLRHGAASPADARRVRHERSGTTFVHGNGLDGAELALIAESGGALSIAPLIGMATDLGRAMIAEVLLVPEQTMVECRYGKSWRSSAFGPPTALLVGTIVDVAYTLT